MGSSRVAVCRFRVALTVVLMALAMSNLDISAATVESPLLRPKSDIMSQPAPATFRVTFQTSRGDFVVEAYREWAPRGVNRFYNLVKHGFYDGTCFFRVVSGFMVQFGIHGDPKISSVWRQEQIQDDPVKRSNTRGFLSYAMAGPNTRTTQLFINYGDNSRLDQMGFAPLARIVEGMEVVDTLYAGYGEGGPRGKGPDQGRIQTEGNDYLSKNFPQLDCIKRATITE
jgi:peptidyl-prolyl cis-trans isomerase A (cyclophilin A)